MSRAIPPAIRHAAQTPLLTADRELELLARVRERDDPDAMAALVGTHLRLAIDVASRYAGRAAPMEDLIAEGALGLCEAARRFDPAHGARFATYATWWVRAYIRTYALKNRRLVALPSTRAGRKVLGGAARAEAGLTARLGRAPSLAELAAALGVEVEDVELVRGALGARDVSIEVHADAPAFPLPSPSPTPEEAVASAQADAQAQLAVERALGTLDRREREIVRRRYLDDEAQTLRTIGRDLGLSRERVRQIELRARDKMRRELDRVA
ncbi:MAG: sigma-70 family RNA polymerase sigma factor [Sandaracinaceae bacterium]|nr:sigma-70 family RNA polymerase sigma factor [Sandaracinaceae bacterium]